MAITNATNFRKNVFKYLDSAIATNDVITVTTKAGNAVILSEEEYNSMVETAYLNSIPGLAEKLIKGMNADDSEFVELNWDDDDV